MIDTVTASQIALPSLHAKRVRGISPKRLAYLYNAVQRQQSWLYAGGCKLSEALKELSKRENITNDEACAILQVFEAIKKEVKVKLN